MVNLISKFSSVSTASRKLAVAALGAGLAFTLAACDEVSPVGGQFPTATTTTGVGGSTGTVVVRKDRWMTAIETALQSPNLNSQIGGAGVAALRTFYQQRDYRPVWHVQGRFGTAAQEAMNRMAGSQEIGLFPGYYLPSNMLQGGSVSSTRDANIAAVTDALLSSGMLMYARDASSGRFNPRPQALPTSEMSNAADQNNLYGWMQSLEPAGISYRGLKQALLSQGPNLDDKQRAKVLLNLERQRWNNEPSGGSFVRVNIPAAELEAFNGDRSEMKMNVVVGRLARKTPFMMDKMVSLKYSPDWTIPKTIITEDFIPKLQKDRSYLQRNGYEVRSRGKIVDSTTINPNDLLNYSVRRPPGGQNPLGGVRFSLTNNQAIYLHDSPGRSQYTAKDRALSSGCVRVADAAGLAQWVHSQQGETFSKGQIESKMSQSQSSTTPLGNRIGVALNYLTAWVDGAGELRFARDIYGLDSALASQMGLEI